MSIHSLLHSFRRIDLLLFAGLIFFSTLQADQTFSVLAKCAEKLFYENLYEDALPLYDQLTKLPCKGSLKTECSLKLALCHLEAKNKELALALLSSIDKEACYPQILYLMSLCHHQTKDSLTALNQLKQCLPLNLSPYGRNLIALEQGYHLIQIGDLSRAQTILKAIDKRASPLTFTLAQLQLAKLFLKSHQYDEAQDCLALLSSLPEKHPLNREKIYLKGLIFLGKEEYLQAIACFEALHSFSYHNQSVAILHGLITSYIKHALSISEDLPSLLYKIELAIEQLLEKDSSEASHLLSANFYLMKARHLGDPSSFAKALEFFNFSSFSKEEIVLKSVEGCFSYEERDERYQKLLSQTNFPDAFYAKIWFCKGRNAFKEGFFKKANQAFTKTLQLKEHISLNEVALSYQYLALGHAHLGKKDNLHQALKILNDIFCQKALLETFKDPEKIYYLFGWIALSLGEKEVLQDLRKRLQSLNPQEKWKEGCLKIEAFACLQLQEWSEAESILTQLLKKSTDSRSKNEILFWLGKAFESQGKTAIKKELFQQIYTEDPADPYAPLAYFYFYSYHEYMQGEKRAIKHLEAMPLLFSMHPLLLSAYYLVGLNNKKDHLFRHKNWTKAIDAFQAAESLFEELFKDSLIPSDSLSYFIQLRYRCSLERGLANLSIAEESKGGKKQIYLEYAEEVFKQIIEEFTRPEALAKKYLIHSLNPYPKIFAEAEFHLSLTYDQKKDWKEEERVLEQSLQRYKQAGNKKSYGLMQVWIQRGKVAQKLEQFEKALDCLLEAENAISNYALLSPNEKINLWIEQSSCYQALGRLEEAMQVLSRAINDSVISPLRIKAMYLRAEIYEKQQRRELALKQLEAAAKNGGEWGEKAQKKLEFYGYP